MDSYDNDFNPEYLRHLARFAVENEDIELRDKLLPYKAWIDGRFNPYTAEVEGNFRGKYLSQQLNRLEKKEAIHKVMLRNMKANVKANVEAIKDVISGDY